LQILRYQTLAIFPFCVDFPPLVCNHTPQAQPIPAVNIILVPREQTGYFWVEHFRVPDFSHFPLLYGFSLNSLQSIHYKPNPFLLSKSFWYQGSRQDISGLNIFRYQTLAIFPFCMDFPSIACNPYITSPTHSCCQNHFGTKEADGIFLG
jgi:hypothetical protein